MNISFSGLVYALRSLTLKFVSFSFHAGFRLIYTLGTFERQANPLSIELASPEYEGKKHRMI